MSEIKTIISNNILPVELGDIPTIMKGDKGDPGRDGSFTQKAYKTYANMVADKDNIPTNTNVVVNNDPDKDKNAYYTYDGTEFTKSDFDPQGILTTIDVRLNQAVESASDYFQSQVADTVATSIDNSTVAYNQAIEVTKGEWANTISTTNAIIKANSEAYLATIPGTVNDAINNTAVDGGVLADTFVTATVKGEGAVARTQKDRNNDTINIKDFGGTGNGITDNTDAFRKAIKYLESIGGGELRIPRGIFLITGDIQLPSNIHIVGAGRGITTIKKGRFTGTNYNMFWTQQTKNTSIRDMSIDGSKELRQVKDAPEGTYYKRYNPEGQQTVIGDYTTIHSTGVKVVSVGTYKHTDYIEYLGFDFKSKPLGTVISVKGVNYEIVEHGVGEWGHGILLRSADTISLERLEILNCWGDGIEIARTFNWLTYLKVDVPYKPYCKDVIIRDVEIHNCRRQGISVLSLKDALIDNVYIHDIHGTAPEAGIDFEPESVDDKLSNIVINNLLTERTGSVGIVVAIVYGFYNVSDEQTLQRLVDSGTVPSDYTSEQFAKGVASSIREGQDEEKISIHINKWVSRDTEGFILSGAVSGKPRGFVNITNSYIESRNLSNKTVYTGVEITKSRHNHPKLNIENTVIHMKDADWDSAVYHNSYQQPDIPVGGWSFKGVRYLFDKESSKETRNLMFITDFTKGTKVFKDIILDDCQVMETSAYGKDIDNVGFLGNYGDTTVGYNEITVKNIPYEDYTITVKADTADFYSPFNNRHPLAFTREDNSIVNITMSFDRFAYSGGETVLKFHNNNCALGSDKNIILRFPSSFTLEGIHWGDVTLSKEIKIPPKGELLLRINKVDAAEIVYISPSTLAATKSNVYLDSFPQNYVNFATLAPSTRFVVKTKLNAGKPNSPVSYNFIPALPVGLVHSITGSKTSPDYELNIDNISSSPISYTGHAYLSLN